MKRINEQRWWQGALSLGLLACAVVGGVAAGWLQPEGGGWPWIGALLWVPWGISLVVWGLPHGAVDHFLLARLFRAHASWALVLLAALVYFMLALAIGVFWWALPNWAFAGFILLTWIHWGSGDLWWSWSRDREALPSRSARWVFLLWRGALPMLLPLVFDAEAYRRTAEAATGLWGRGGDWMILESTEARLGALMVCLVLAVLRWLTAGRGQGVVMDRREDVALVFFFSVVPALPAVGLYFTFWHGWRHVLRLQNQGPGSPGADRCLGQSFIREAWPTTLISLALLGALAYGLGLPAWDNLWPLLGIYLLLIACLTVPHALLVTLMDCKGGVWKKKIH